MNKLDDFPDKTEKQYGSTKVVTQYIKSPCGDSFMKRITVNGDLVDICRYIKMDFGWLEV